MESWCDFFIICRVCKVHENNLKCETLEIDPWAKQTLVDEVTGKYEADANYQHWQEHNWQEYGNPREHGQFNQDRFFMRRFVYAGTINII